MCDYPISIEPALPGQHHKIESILDRAFGLGRRTKTSYRFREGERPVDGLSFVAVNADGKVVGAISYWHLRIGQEGHNALLLGPLAVEPELQAKGIGRRLMRHSLAVAGEHGHGLILLVGDEPYYARVGFARVPDGKLQLPGPVDPDRLLYLELKPDSLTAASGMVLSPRRFSALRDTT
jgi:predicted N-acetyltransferase YhbS